MKSSIVLVLDSSTPTLFLGLIKDKQTLGHHVELLERRHAELMLPCILGFLKRFNYKIEDITDVVVGHGPGSFTGVRLALTLIKTLGLMQPLKVFPISTLHLFAHQPKVIISLDARGERQYIAAYQGLKVLANPQILSNEAIPSWKLQFPKTTSLTVEEALKEPDAILQHILDLLDGLLPLVELQKLNPLYLKDLV
ncbi:MAG: hypothetical protein RLZZ264_472 [Bacillota bacterium]|jgi:tRNA threonylcarbamoyl adenosine modification protein YeaZ